MGWHGSSQGEMRRMRARVKEPGGGWYGGGEGFLDVSAQESHRGWLVFITQENSMRTTFLALP
jgi:hypothetical protein